MIEFIDKEVEIELTEDQLGTVPKNKEVYAKYIETKKPVDEDTEAENIEEIEDKGWTGFMQDEKGIFMYNYMVKGFLKHAGNVLKNQVKVKNLKSKIQQNVKILPRKIYFNKDKPDGILERPLRAFTPSGPRVTVTRSDTVKAGTKIKFTVRRLKGSEVSERVIDALLEYGQWEGLGQWRSGEYGQFKVL